MREPAVDGKDLGEGLSSLEEARHGVNAVLVVSLLGVGDELRDEPDEHLGIFLLLAVHERKHEEKFFNEPVLFESLLIFQGLLANA